MNFLTSVLIFAAIQAVSFLPFLRVYQQDKKKYGNDLGVPLWKRLVSWLVMCPMWALPFMTLIGG